MLQVSISISVTHPIHVLLVMMLHLMCSLMLMEKADPVCRRNSGHLMMLMVQGLAAAAITIAIVPGIVLLHRVPGIKRLIR